MKKILIPIIMGSILLGVGGVIFINKNFLLTQKSERNFYLISGYRTEYPFKIAISKNTSYLKAALLLNPNKSENVKNIYIKNGRKWEEVDARSNINKDSLIKISYEKT